MKQRFTPEVQIVIESVFATANVVILCLQASAAYSDIQEAI